jgi:hypothetical protein
MEQALDITLAGYFFRTAGVDRDAESEVTAARLSMLAVVVLVLKTVVVVRVVTEEVGVTVATRAL